MAGEGRADVGEGAPNGNLLDPELALRVQTLRRRCATQSVAVALPETQTWCVPQWQELLGVWL